MNYGLVNFQCKFTSKLARTFSHELQLCTLSFPLKRFAIHGICDWLWENPPVTHKDNYLDKRD